MLKLCAAQLKQQASVLKTEEDLVWIDIGGGTGVYSSQFVATDPYLVDH
jgi:hypothetical protein